MLCMVCSLFQKTYLSRQYSTSKTNCAFTCLMFLINVFEGKRNKILPLDHQWCSIDKQMVLEISMHGYLQSLQLPTRSANIQAQVFFCSHLCRGKWGKMMLRGQQSLLRTSAVYLLHQSVTGGGKRGFPITMVHSWRPCWLLSAGSILYHEHPILTRKEATKYSF